MKTIRVNETLTLRIDVYNPNPGPIAFSYVVERIDPGLSIWQTAFTMPTTELPALGAHVKLFTWKFTVEGLWYWRIKVTYDSESMVIAIPEVNVWELMPPTVSIGW